MKKKRVLFISYHFDPSNEVGARRPSHTALALADASYELIVIRAVSATTGKSEVSTASSAIRCISIKSRKKGRSKIGVIVKQLRELGRRRTKEPAQVDLLENDSTKLYDKKGGVIEFARAVESFLQYNKRWLLEASFHATWVVLTRRPDVVITSGPPVVSHLCGLWASVLGRVPLILDYRDPWYTFDDPEHAELNPFGRHKLIGRFEKYLALRCAYRCNAAVVAAHGIGRHLVDTIGIDPSKVHVIRNGFDGVALSTPIVADGSFVVLFCGSLYWNRNPFDFLLAVELFVADPSVDRSIVSINFVGKCEWWNRIDVRKWIMERGLDDVVSILPPVSPIKIEKMVEKSHLLLNLAQGQARQIPAKSYEYVASGRPSLVIAEPDSDVARLFEEAGTGTTVPPGRIDLIEEVLMVRYREVKSGVLPTPVNKVHLEGFSRRHQVRIFRELVDDIVGKRAST